MTSTIPLVRCGFGLGNRVAAIAHGLAMLGQIRFVWRVNDQCPANHDQVFPHGIPGVEFVTDAPMGYATKIGKHRIHEWEFGNALPSRRETFATVIKSMTGNPSHKPELAIVLRFRRFDMDPAAIAQRVADEASRIGASRAFVLADSHREAIAAELAKRGIQSDFPQSPEMGHDFDRTAQSVIDFCADWKTSLASKHLISIGGGSSLLFPFMAKSMVDIRATGATKAPWQFQTLKQFSGFPPLAPGRGHGFLSRQPSD